MSDFILLDGDKAIFQSDFLGAMVIPVEGSIKASGAASFNGSKICIEGDEASVEVKGVLYSTPLYTTLGTGTLLIESLAANHIATHTKSAGTAVMLKGGSFCAKFRVQSPATHPVSGTPDSITEYYGGNGVFVNSNSKVKAT